MAAARWQALTQLSARAGDSTMHKAPLTCRLPHTPRGRDSLCASLATRTSGLCKRNDSRGTTSMEILRRWSRRRPLWSTRSTSWLVQGGRCISTSRDCRLSTQTNSSALVMLVAMVSRLECRISLRTPPPTGSASDEYVDVE